MVPRLRAAAAGPLQEARHRPRRRQPGRGEDTTDRPKGSREDHGRGTRRRLYVEREEPQEGMCGSDSQRHMPLSHIYGFQLAYSVCGTNSYSESVNVHVPIAYVVRSVPGGYSRYAGCCCWLACHWPARLTFRFRLLVLQVKATHFRATGGAWVSSCSNVCTGMARTCDGVRSALIPCPRTRYPPFVSNSRHVTRQKILNWKQTLRFPSRPRISHEGVDVMQRLLCEPEDRLGSQSTVSTTRPNSLIVSVRRSGFFGQLGGGSASVDGAELIKVKSR